MSRRAFTALLLWSAWAVCAAALAVPAVIWARRAHDAALAAAQVDVSRATASGARATENVIGLVDVFLRRLSEAAVDGGLSGASIDRICPSLICSNNRRVSPYLIMAFTNSGGDVLVYSPELPAVSLADRDYFIAQKEKDAGLYVGLPRRTPFVEGLFLPMSRRLASKDGSFDGIVAAAFNTDLIRAVFQGQGIGRLDRMRLTNARGHPLVEWSAGAAGTGTAAQGHVEDPACGLTNSRPGPDAMVSALALPLGGLSVEACRSTANALQPWREQVSLIAGLEALLLLAAALAVPAVRRRWESRWRQQMGLRGLVVEAFDAQFIVAARHDGTFVLEALTFMRGVGLDGASARLVGRPTRELFPAEDAEAIEAEYRAVLASGETRRSERRIRLGGAQFVWSTVLVPLGDGRGGGHIYGAASDMAGNGTLEGGLRRFTENALRREDNERRRIARELHDTTGQNLIAAGFELGIVERGLVQPSPRVRAAMTQARALIEASVAEVRTLSYVLHPALLDEAGLAVALATLAEGFERRAGIRVDVAVADGLSGRRWPPEIELALYRVAQEAITNVQRHASTKAARLVLRVGAPGHLELTVEDGTRSPGALTDATPIVEGSGIRGMRDRIEALGGSLTLTRLDGGLRVLATVPEIEGVDG